MKPWLCWSCYPNATHLLKSLLFLPQRNPAGDPWPILIQGWTLVYDMYFYLLFALSLFVPLRFRLLFLGVAICGLSSLGLLSAPQGIAAQSYTNPIMLGFLGGVVIGEMYSDGWLLRSRGQGFAVLAAGIALYLGLTVTHTRYEGPLILIWVGSALMIFYACLSLEALGWVLRFPYADRLGAWSYAVYLMHGLVLPVVFVWMPGSALVKLMMIFGLTTAAGAALHEGVEKLINRLARRLEARSLGRVRSSLQAPVAAAAT